MTLAVVDGHEIGHFVEITDSAFHVARDAADEGGEFVDDLLDGDEPFGVQLLGAASFDALADLLGQFPQAAPLRGPLACPENMCVEQLGVERLDKETGGEFLEVLDHPRFVDQHQDFHVAKPAFDLPNQHIDIPIREPASGYDHLRLGRSYLRKGFGSVSSLHPPVAEAGHQRFQPSPA
ncbi:MAG: hypothetical protein H6R38_603 [Deltaproteobacteria bacterium]|nr:hypothetical protein [Deltaproteobacteria bacterium]